MTSSHAQKAWAAAGRGEANAETACLAHTSTRHFCLPAGIGLAAPAFGTVSDVRRCRWHRVVFAVVVTSRSSAGVTTKRPKQIETRLAAHVTSLANSTKDISLFRRVGFGLHLLRGTPISLLGNSGFNVSL